MWAEPFLIDGTQLRYISFNHRDPWFLKRIEMFDETNIFFKGKMPVGLPLLRGPGDIASAIRGNDHFCMDMILAPYQITELLDIYTET